jgi:hypothetical protein
VDETVSVACGVAVTVIEKVLVPTAYKDKSVGVKVAVIVELPGATRSTLAPPVTALTVAEEVFELE